jgi:Tfp pilus assembly protein PilW
MTFTLLRRSQTMAGWMTATPVAEAIEALAQAMLRTGYVPAAIQDEFHARVAADVLVRELRTMGYDVVPTVQETDADTRLNA